MKFSEMIIEEKNYILRLAFYGCTGGLIYSFAENYLVGTPLLPLIVRAGFLGLLLFCGVGFFEIRFKEFFRKHSFVLTLVLRSICYLFMIIIWLLIINGIYEASKNDVSFFNGIAIYYNYSGMVVKNMIALFSIIIFINALIQINSPHRKGELVSFILGRYHKPIEKSRIFLFIDLKSSTTIAEQLGHIRFGIFLQEYYFDLAKAARLAKGEIYDYIGDEAIISWPVDRQDSLENCLKCIELMREILEKGKERYFKVYGVSPGFRAGAHGGKSVIMWVGEDRKEILYLGDVLNTTKRIQTECNRFSTDFLLSGDLIKCFPGHDLSRFKFLDNILLKGKGQEVELYSVL